jgi:methionyl-tRNA formyltransferase
MPEPSESRERPRAIFFGTPALAVPTLQALTTVAEVVLVVSQPDKPVGRGLRLSPTPIKAYALEHGLEVLQPIKVRTPDFAQSLHALRADVAVVIAYGRILPKAVLEAPRLGCLNIHASLLPKLRGAAPIQWAILQREPETGVCLMQMDEGMDTGAVLACERTPILASETAGELGERLSRLGGSLIARELPRFVRGELTPEPQDHANATHAPMLTKEHGRIDWQRSALELDALVRGLSPWPGAFSVLDETRVRIHRAHVLDADASASSAGSPADAGAGTIVRADRHGIEVACGRGVLVIDELQEDGRRRLSAEQFCAGHAKLAGKRFARVAEEP